MPSIPFSPDTTHRKPRKAPTARRRVGAFLSPGWTCEHGVRLRPRGFNVYWPCGKGCGTQLPYRWWHRLGVPF